MTTNDKPISIQPKILDHCSDLVDYSRQRLFLAMEIIEADRTRTGEVLMGAISILGAVQTLLEIERGEQ